MGFLNCLGFLNFLCFLNFLNSWGALSARKKSDIQQNLLFEDPGWERLENLKYRNFWSFQVFSGSSHALAALSIT